MNEQPSRPHKLAWKWVAITFVLYLVFYLLPILVAATFLVHAVPGIGEIIIGAWTFAGIIIVAAVAGYLSEGVTIVEPALANILTIVVWIFIFVLFVPGGRIDIKTEAITTSVILGVVFMLSLLGAWFGERAQKLWKERKS